MQSLKVLSREVKAMQRNSFETLIFFVTGRCNAKCHHCFYWENLGPKQFGIALENIEKIAASMPSFGTLLLSGGEPTLQSDLSEFVRRARSYGYAIKLDTNGYRPDVLAALLDENLLDYVAMDIKAPPEKYAQLSGILGIDVALIERSITLFTESHIPHEFRTTVVPDMLTIDDIETLAQWLASVVGDPSSLTLYLQQFRALNTLDPALNQSSPYPVTVLQTMAERAWRWLPHVVVRGM
jgi:pyruvate formate lyase activating enzyme